MSDWTSLALFQTAGYLEKVLAIIGGFVVGGLGTGLFVQGVTGLLTGQKLPRVGVWLVRIMGGGLMAWLVSLWVFGIGSGGFGWGGNGGGQGANNGDRKESTASKETGPVVKPKEETKDGKELPPPSKPILKIEILGHTPLKKLGVDEQHCYRVTEPGGAPKLMTLAEVQEKITPGNGEPVWKHIQLVVYDDSPSEKEAEVARLREWIRGLLPKEAKDKIQDDLLRLKSNAALS